MIYSINGKEVEVILSFDDGCKEDIHIAELLRKYKLPAIFYIPSKNRKLTDEQVKELSLDFTIGGHTKNHRFLRTIPPPDAEAEIVEGKTDLEELIGKKITSFCYPRGQFTPEVKEMVRMAGFYEGRTTRVLATQRAWDAYELDTTIHVYPRKEYNDQPWLELAIKFFDNTLSRGGYFHLWAHGWELEKLGYWKDFEFMLSYISQRLHKQQ